MKEDITVVIPLYNPDIELLRGSLGLILENSISNRIKRIILVDDGSPEPVSNHLKVFRSISGKILMLRQLNKGPGGARNQGALHADTDIIIFMDQDCVPSKTWLENLLKPLDSGNFVAVMGRINSHQISSRVACYLDYIVLLRKPKRGLDNNYKCLISANFAIFRDVFKKIGGFDERLTIAAEDLDLTYRLVKEGFGKKLYYAEDAIVCHRHRENIADFSKQQFGYAFATMSHCILRGRDPLELGFPKPTLLNSIPRFFMSFIVSADMARGVSAEKYGILNKFLVFPFLDLIRRLNLLSGNIYATYKFPLIKKRLENINVRKSVRIIIKNEENQYLIMEKPDGGLGLAGGGVESGETLEHAIDRECQEELGISVKEMLDLSVVGRVYKKIKINYHFDECVYVGTINNDVVKKIKLSSEHKAIFWYNLNEAPFPVKDELEGLLNLKKRAHF